LSELRGLDAGADAFVPLHGGGSGVLRMWREPTEVLCEISDSPCTGQNFRNRVGRTPDTTGMAIHTELSGWLLILG
jgi:hypothetical protein